MPAALHDHIDEAVFDGLMAAQGPLGACLAVAVSGGADSTALLMHLARWCAAEQHDLLVVTVDHGLRAESAAEARAVESLCENLGVPHSTLVWRGEKPKSGRQEAARVARYRLLHEFCLLEGIEDLFLAHHADDQAETFVMRLLAGSGYEGLAAMPATGQMGSVRLRRPLLSVRKTALEEALAREGLTWTEDPTNKDPAYLRTLLRDAAGGLPSVSTLWAEARSFGYLRRTSDRALARLARQAVQVFPAGFALLDPRPVAAAGEVLGPRVLAHLLQDLGGRPYPASPKTLDELWARLPLPSGETLSGCRLAPLGEQLCIFREAARVEQRALEPGRACLWDRRYEVICGPRLDPGLTLSPLGEAGIAQLRADGQGGDLDRVPGLVRPMLPALYKDGKALLALFLGDGNVEKPLPELEIRYIAPQLVKDVCFTVADP